MSEPPGGQQDRVQCGAATRVEHGPVVALTNKGQPRRHQARVVVLCFVVAPLNHQAHRRASSN